MTESIREQILAAIATKLGAVKTTAGYHTSIGSNVFRCLKEIDPDDDVPGCVIWDGLETSEEDYGDTQNTMPVTIEAFAVFGSTNVSTVTNRLLADLKEAVSGTVYTMPYTSGSTEITVGQTITGAIGKATAYIVGVTLASGTWAGGDAAGVLTLRRLVGAFRSENLNVGTSLNVATTTGVTTAQSAVTTTTGGLADSIQYETGGPASPPDGGDILAGVQAKFNIKYQTRAGDPYHSPS